MGGACVSYTNNTRKNVKQVYSDCTLQDYINKRTKMLISFLCSLGGRTGSDSIVAKYRVSLDFLRAVAELVIVNDLKYHIAIVENYEILVILFGTRYMSVSVPKSVTTTVKATIMGDVYVVTTAKHTDEFVVTVHKYSAKYNNFHVRAVMYHKYGYPKLFVIFERFLYLTSQTFRAGGGGVHAKIYDIAYDTLYAVPVVEYTPYPSNVDTVHVHETGRCDNVYHFAVIDKLDVDGVKMLQYRMHDLDTNCRIVGTTIGMCGQRGGYNDAIKYIPTIQTNYGSGNKQNRVHLI